jgi:hypothetical protein
LPFGLGIHIEEKKKKKNTALTLCTTG